VAVAALLMASDDTTRLRWERPPAV